MSAILAAMGALTLGAAVTHMLFTPLFGWANNLRQLNDVNRRSALTLNGMMIYALALIGLADMAWAFGLLRPQSLIVGAVAGYWITRLILQWLYFDLRQRLSWLFTPAFVFLAGGHLFFLTRIG